MCMGFHKDIIIIGGLMLDAEASNTLYMKKYKKRYSSEIEIPLNYTKKNHAAEVNVGLGCKLSYYHLPNDYRVIRVK